MTQRTTNISVSERPSCVNPFYLLYSRNIVKMKLLKNMYPVSPNLVPRERECKIASDNTLSQINGSPISIQKNFSQKREIPQGGSEKGLVNFTFILSQKLTETRHAWLGNCSKKLLKPKPCAQKIEGLIHVPRQVHL